MLFYVDFDNHPNRQAGLAALCAGVSVLVWYAVDMERSGMCFSAHSMAGRVAGLTWDLVEWFNQSMEVGP